MFKLDSALENNTKIMMIDFLNLKLTNLAIKYEF